MTCRLKLFIVTLSLSHRTVVIFARSLDCAARLHLARCKAYPVVGVASYCSGRGFILYWVWLHTVVGVVSHCSGCGFLHPSVLLPCMCAIQTQKNNTTNSLANYLTNHENIVNQKFPAMVLLCLHMQNFCNNLYRIARYFSLGFIFVMVLGITPRKSR